MTATPRRDLTANGRVPALAALLTFTRIAVNDLLGVRPRSAAPEAHLRAAEEWLRRAHDQSHDGGISYGYSVRGGWRPSYPETSGYIATTFFDLARRRNNTDYRDRALRICRWLLDIQGRDGSFSNPRYGDAGIVFDTGQDLFALVQAHEQTRETIFRVGALRAADWLVDVADARGVWTRNEYLDTPHVYNTRTAWAILRANQVAFGAGRERVARANLDWAVSEQQPSGFFAECAFKRGMAPFTHTIAYATRGLLESGELLEDQRYIDAAQRCADAVRRHVREDGFLPGQIAINGKAVARYCCLTGNCQFAIIWAKLFDRTTNEEYRNVTIRALDYVMRCQDIYTANPDMRGAIKGSDPVWGRYARLTFPNWAAKFFVDAMLLRSRWP